MHKQFDFPSFIDRIIDKSYYEMIHAAETAAAETERISFGIKGCVKNRQAGSPQYTQELKKFLFFMRKFRLPASADMFDINQYKRVTEKLIERGEFKKSAIEIFEK